MCMHEAWRCTHKIVNFNCNGWGRAISLLMMRQYRMGMDTRYFWMGILLFSLICDFDILCGQSSAYFNNHLAIETARSKINNSSLEGNFTNNNFDARNPQLTMVSFGHGDAEKAPDITSITVAPNPSTKGDKVILNVMVADKNSTGLIYLWSEIGNLVVSLNGADTPRPSFMAPHVRGDKNVTFCVTVTNEIGRTSYGNITATIKASNEAAKINSIVLHETIANSTILQ